MGLSPNSRSTADLIGDAFSQLAILVRNEVELARAELAATAGKIGQGAALAAAGAVLMIPALVMVLFAVAAWLVYLGLSEPLAYLVAGGGAALIAAALVWAGLSRMSSQGLKPQATLAQFRRDKDVARELIR